MQMYLSQDLVYPDTLVSLPFPLSFHVSVVRSPRIIIKGRGEHSHAVKSPQE